MYGTAGLSAPRLLDNERLEPQEPYPLSGVARVRLDRAHCHTANDSRQLYRDRMNAPSQLFGVIDSNGMTGDPWLDFWLPFLLSPGAAAAAALIAALIALGTSVSAQRRRDKVARQEQWWTATTWAADQTLSGDPYKEVAGYEALTALGNVLDWQISKYQAAFLASLTRGVFSHYDFEPGETASPNRPASTISDQEN